MSQLRIISDLHLGHRNLAKNLRGFDSVDDHDNHIIEQWNSVVGKRDVVWILGDITLENKKYYPLLGQMNGKKRVIGGNHDFAKHMKELLNYVESVSGCVNKRGFILTHIPIHPSCMERFKGNIHGHIHKGSMNDNRYINVSAEVLDYKPILFKEIEERYE